VETESSRLLQFSADYINRLASKDRPDPHTILSAALDDPDLIGDDRRAALAALIHDHVRDRDSHALSVRQKIQLRWGKALAAFEVSIATAEVLNHALLKNFFREIPEESSFGQSFARRYGREMLGGPRLKVLLHAGMQARACVTATEILELLRAGLSQAADSRTRSLYEQNVISFILSNDRTYEVCERYHDAAAIEQMRYIEAHNKYSEQIGWQPIEGQELEEAKKFADLAVRNWGSEIRNQYGWARPIASHVPKGKLIRFADLERVVKGEKLKPGYIWMNNSVHAGPSTVIESVNIDNKLGTVTRPSGDDDPRATATWALELLLTLTKVTVFTVAWITESYDDFLDVGELQRRVDETWDLFSHPDRAA
jgi:Family of unknown function (DUF5677)